MASKKRKHKRHTKRFGRRRGHRDKRIPIIATVGGIGSIFAPRTSGQMSLGAWVVNTLQGGHPSLTDPNGPLNMAADTVAQYLGYDFRNGSWGIPTASVVLVGSGLASKLVNRFAGNTFKNIPIVGKYIKW
jgi:hypothetical protein